jgi:hypothetical protein
VSPNAWAVYYSDAKGSGSAGLGGFAPGMSEMESLFSDMWRDAAAVSWNRSVERKKGLFSLSNSNFYN